ncbi:MAG: hypothetical protein ACTINN_09605, partial [Brachybacterium tyrofermentans]
MTSENDAPQPDPDAGTTPDTSTADTPAEAGPDAIYAEAGPDAIFADPRLAACYDIFDGERDDLDHYESILEELGAR